MEAARGQAKQLNPVGKGLTLIACRGISKADMLLGVQAPKLSKRHLALHLVFAPGMQNAKQLPLCAGTEF